MSVDRVRAESPDPTTLDAMAPIIIIGAARSGTNMLRNALMALGGFRTWPCDEINYIWRYDNARVPHDELGPEHATPRARRYIQRAFRRIAAGGSMRTVIEKTCANSLRVSFVRTVFPRARFVFLVRDGRDATSSAMKRWRGRAGLGYLLRKARYVPAKDLPYYAARFARSRLARVGASDGRVATWGPRFVGMDTLAREAPLSVVCATQWLRSIERAEVALAPLSPDEVRTVRYEEFVRDPLSALRDLADFLGAECSERALLESAKSVTNRNVGKWHASLSTSDVALVESVLGPTLSRLGYS